jgi:predicted CXXCH cytochrome family protein
MNARLTSHRPCRLVFAAAFLALLVGPRAASGQTLDPQPSPDAAAPDTCEGCHASDRDVRVSFPDGSSLPAFVDPTSFAHSVHAERFTCEDCHRDTGAWPHAPLPFATAADYRKDAEEMCRRCHAEHGELAADGIHARAKALGNPTAPGCTDCHGAHDVAAPGKSRLAVAALCGQCHTKQAEAFGKSVHARALTEGNPDVPACTDCHGAHAIADTRAAGYHAASYTVCARCHGDAKMMAKYELSENILTTYLDDFHGSSNHLYTQVGYLPERPVATCGDCHGFHDVQSIRDTQGQGAAAVRERAEAMCRNCHEGAPEGFSGAWLAHEVPSIEAAPLVWGITWGYRFLIPLMILGLVLHILLHLWRLPVKGV